jgi:hypothetical protein
MTSNTRKQRGLVQKLYLVETLPIKTDFVREYIIMGSTGNIYQVSISHMPTCTCPDFKQRGQRCKHIFFVLARIMKVDNNETAEYSDMDLINMFAKIPKATQYLIEPDKKIKYDSLKNKTNIQVKPKDLDDVCPICLDDLTDGNELDMCKYSCGKHIHKKCYEMMNKSTTEKICVFCRHPWESNEYINLS